jgi:hypothetical protein
MLVSALQVKEPETISSRQSRCIERELSMKKNSSSYLVKDAELTPISNTKGHEIYICDPPWFDELKKYKITNAPERTSSLEFDGMDLNYMARVLYAEASGSLQLSDKSERAKEKAAIINVNHFRINRKGYPNNKYVAKNFREVCDAPGQFESVFPVEEKHSGKIEQERVH